MNSESDIDMLRKYLSYDVETGIFTRIVSHGASRSGAVVGTQNSHGYLTFWISDKRYLAHRAAFAMHYGHWPELTIDHINHIKTDNRISNLREADIRDNIANRGLLPNNTSGYIGVNKGKSLKNPWTARLKVNKKALHLGNFPTAEAAARAYDRASILHNGEFASLNFPDNSGKDVETGSFSAAQISDACKEHQRVAGWYDVAGMRAALELLLTTGAIAMVRSVSDEDVEGAARSVCKWFGEDPNETFNQEWYRMSDSTHGVNKIPNWTGYTDVVRAVLDHFAAIAQEKQS